MTDDHPPHDRRPGWIDGTHVPAEHRPTVDPTQHREPGAPVVDSRGNVWSQVLADRNHVLLAGWRLDGTLMVFADPGTLATEFLDFAREVTTLLADGAS